jgi:hypothetical protein
MSRTLSIPVGVVIAREKVDSAWQAYAWRLLDVFLNAPEITQWRELRRGADFVHYHAATLPLELHPKETLGYRANLDEETPCVYVVLRQRPDGDDPPIDVALVTASGYEAEAYGLVMEETVANIAMPQPLLEVLEAYVAEHHVEEPFVKRQRLKHHRAEVHNFGQEPIGVLRERMRKIGDGD